MLYSIMLYRNQFSITSGQGWWRPILCTGKWVKNSLPRWSLRLGRWTAPTAQKTILKLKLITLPLFDRPDIKTFLIIQMRFATSSKKFASEFDDFLNIIRLLLVLLVTLTDYVERFTVYMSIISWFINYFFILRICPLLIIII